jgi:hypothetical protein
MIASIDINDGSSYEVVTESSSYILNLDDKLAIRVPGKEAENLRKDREWFRIHKILSCEIGKPMILLCSEINDRLDVFTTRRSTHVIKITELKEETK